LYRFTFIFPAVLRVFLGVDSSIPGPQTMSWFAVSLTAMNHMKIQVFWDVTLCQLVNSYQHFRAAQCHRGPSTPRRVAVDIFYSYGQLGLLANGSGSAMHWVDL
jgi:hypothetical protein